MMAWNWFLPLIFEWERGRGAVVSRLFACCSFAYKIYYGKKLLSL